VKAPLPADTLAAFGGDELRARTFFDKYAARDEQNAQLETLPTQMWDRIAREIASVEPDAERRAHWTGRFRWLMGDYRMIPGGRVMTGAGNPRHMTLANCYVLPSPPDSIEGIFRTCHEMAETYKRGGGCGFDISTLRPNGTPTRNAAITSSGAVSFINLFSTTTGTIGQRGRRGALMISLGDTHPDVLAFTRVKRDHTSIKFANISVRISHAFMQAVEDDKEWVLEFANEADRYHIRKVIRAHQLWSEITTGARDFAEPGVLFWDTVKAGSTSEYAGMEVISTNPCSEIPQGANHNCTLANVNLAAFVDTPFTPQARINLPQLMEAVSDTVRFLDDVLDYNAPRHALAAQREASLASRRIGVGFTGLADLLIQLGIRYDSEAAVHVTDRLFREIKEVAYATSVSLAQEKGAFPLFDADKHLASSFFTSFPGELVDSIRTIGLRNVALLTVPPVGSGAALAGVSSGIEPVFATQYIRRSESLSQGEFTVDHPLVTQYRQISGTKDTDPLPETFVTAHEIDPEARILLQATLQKHIDQGISVTVNLPRDTTPATVAKIYRMAWEAGCKGITVYREGSREGILLTRKEAEERSHGIESRLAGEINRLVEAKVLPSQAKLSPSPNEIEISHLAQAIDVVLKHGPMQLSLTPDDRPLRQRPAFLPGITVAQPAPEGNLQVTFNEVEGELFEILCHGGKAGSDINAWAQATARLCSIILRFQRLPSALERLQLIADQLEGIAGSRSIGFGPNRVRSGPDAIGQASKRYMEHKQGGNGNGRHSSAAVPQPALALDAPAPKPTNENGNFCPQCGGANLITDDGCTKCECGFREC
jgi:ribonucleoside-diphosphate reductase alpha chain